MIHIIKKLLGLSLFLFFFGFSINEVIVKGEEYTWKLVPSTFEPEQTATYVHPVGINEESSFISLLRPHFFVRADEVKPGSVITLSGLRSRTADLVNHLYEPAYLSDIEVGGAYCEYKDVKRELTGNFILEKNAIDTEITEGDGQSLADINGDGKNNIIVGTGNGGEVFWYEKTSPAKWVRHLIADGYIEVEGTIVGDFNGDGMIEVIILDQRGNKVDIAKQDTEDPRGSWSAITLDPAANYVQQGKIMDVNGDGKPDFLYAYEGAGVGNGGFYWMENKVGDVMDHDNWEKHEIKQIEGAWWIDFNSPKDWGGKGTGDIAVGVREIPGRNPGSVNGGIYIYKQPASLNDPWIEEAIDTTFPTLQVSSGDLTGNGDNRDLIAGASHDSNDSGLYIYDFTNGWTIIEVESQHNWWGTYAFDINKNGRAEIVSGERTNNTIRIYSYDEDKGRYELQVSDSFIKPDDQIIFDDISGDGHVTEFYVGSDPAGVFWYRAFKLSGKANQ